MHKIGSVILSGELFLAPMADYTNVAFRTLCKEYGAALTYTELISAKALTMKSKRTEGMLRVSEKEKPVFLQLFGSNPADFEKAIGIVEKKYGENFAGYDLNCGCSVPKALRGKYGCSLMNEPQIVGQIISSMKASTKKPVTIKMRLGLKEETFLQVAKEAVNAGVDAITLHPRFGKEGYSGEAKWEKIKQIKEEFGVPIIGNGDIKTVEDIIQMKKQTGCDFEMVGRAAIGNAFFFKQVKEFLQSGKLIEKTKQDSKEEAERYFELLSEFSLKPNDARHYFIGLAKGFSGAGELRSKIGMSKSIEEMQMHLNNYFG